MQPAAGHPLNPAEFRSSTVAGTQATAESAGMDIGGPYGIGANMAPNWDMGANMAPNWDVGANNNHMQPGAGISSFFVPPPQLSIPIGLPPLAQWYPNLDPSYLSYLYNNNRRDGLAAQFPGGPIATTANSIQQNSDLLGHQAVAAAAVASANAAANAAAVATANAAAIATANAAAAAAMNSFYQFPSAAFSAVAAGFPLSYAGNYFGYQFHPPPEYPMDYETVELTYGPTTTGCDCPGDGTEGYGRPDQYF